MAAKELQHAILEWWNGSFKERVKDGISIFSRTECESMGAILPRQMTALVRMPPSLSVCICQICFMTSVDTSRSGMCATMCTRALMLSSRICAGMVGRGCTRGGACGAGLVGHGIRGACVCGCARVRECVGVCVCAKASIPVMLKL